MDHDAAGEIQHAHAGQPAAAPDPVSHRYIDDEQPKRRDQQNRGEPDALDIGSDDQRRVTTPGAAVRAGADYLVIGRPVTRAPDPVAALAAVERDIETPGG